MAVKLMRSAGCHGLRVKILSRVPKQCTAAYDQMRVTRMIRLMKMIKLMRMMKNLQKTIKLPAASLTLSMQKTR